MQLDALAVYADQTRVAEIVENARQGFRGQVKARGDYLLAGGEVDLARRIAVGDLQQLADDALNARAQGVGLDILDQAVQADRHARQQLVGEGRVLVDELGDDGLTDMD